MNATSRKIEYHQARLGFPYQDYDYHLGTADNNLKFYADPDVWKQYNFYPAKMSVPNFSPRPIPAVQMSLSYSPRPTI